MHLDLYDYYCHFISLLCSAGKLAAICENEMCGHSCERESERERVGESEGDQHRGSLQSRSCQPGISKMNRKLTIGCSLYTLEDRISILIHYKLGEEKHKIQSLLVGLNTRTHGTGVKKKKT